MSPINVLIAEDHKVISTAWKLFLESDAGFRVVGIAANGEKAIELALALKPDIVLMDLKMPVLDGLSATRVLVEMLPRTKVLGVAASTDAQEVAYFLEVGAAGYVSKYAHANELKQAIIATMQGCRWVCSHVRDRFLAGLSQPPAATVGHNQLNERELELANLLAQGHTAASIAAILGLSEKNIEVHCSQIFKKLGVENRVQIAEKLQLMQKAVKPDVHC